MVSRRGNQQPSAPRLLTLILVVAGLVLATASAAAGQSRRSSAAPTWIVFTAGTPGFAAEQIFRINSSGTGLKKLTRGRYASGAPAFSADGKRIAFARLGVGIFSMTPDGTGLRRLTTNGRDSYPAWSSDGKQIAFIRPIGTAWRLFVMSASGAGERQLRLAPAAGRPSWTPRGLVIPTTDGDLAKIDPQSGRVQKRLGAFIDASTGLTAATVSPDLSMTTYVGPRPPDPGDRDCGDGVACQHYGLFTQDLRKHKMPRLLVKDAGPASFSGDGKSLAFVAKNRIVLWLLKNSTSRTIATGKVHPNTSTPPVLQPR